MMRIKEYPPFSVLMSLYIKEKAEFFEQCMESIVNQTVKPSEIVIVFDGAISKELKRSVDTYVSTLRFNSFDIAPSNTITISDGFTV